MDYRKELRGNRKIREWLYSRGLSDDAIRVSGLGWRPKDSVDPYSERILFPVYSLDGQFITYQARSLTDTPKYWHRSYDKSAHIEGLYQCLPAVLSLRQITLVEGPIDRIILNHLGIPAGALLGATVSPMQVAIIASLCDHVYSMFDNDEAGEAAHAVLVDLMKPYEIPVTRIKFKHSKDPSEVFERSGSFRAVIQALAARGGQRYDEAVYRTVQTA